MINIPPKWALGAGIAAVIIVVVLVVLWQTGFFDATNPEPEPAPAPTPSSNVNIDKILSTLSFMYPNCTSEAKSLAIWGDSNGSIAVSNVSQCPSGFSVLPSPMPESITSQFPYKICNPDGKPMNPPASITDPLYRCVANSREAAAAPEPLPYPPGSIPGSILNGDIVCPDNYNGFKLRDGPPMCIPNTENSPMPSTSAPVSLSPVAPAPVPYTPSQITATPAPVQPSPVTPSAPAPVLSSSSTWILNKLTD